MSGDCSMLVSVQMMKLKLKGDNIISNTLNIRNIRINEAFNSKAMNSKLAHIRYSLRCRLYHAGAEKAVQFLGEERESKNRGTFLFWRACSLGLSGNDRDAMKILKAMRIKHRYLDYAILSALIWFHQNAVLAIDSKELSKLERSLQAAKECNYTEGFVLASEFLFYVKQFDAAYSCLNTAIAQKSSRMSTTADIEELVQQDIHRMFQWLKTTPNSRGSEGSDDYLQRYDGLDPPFYDIDIVMAEAKCHDMNNDPGAALLLFDTITNKDAAFFPAFIERGKILLQMRRFQEALDSALRGWNASGQSDIEALRLLTLIQYLYGNDESQRYKNLNKIVSLLTQRQGGKANIDFCYETSKLFSRVCNNRPSLEVALNLMATVCATSDGILSGNGLLEYARQLRSLDQYGEAVEQYQLASELDQSDSRSLQGVVVCQALAGDENEAKEQFEFLNLVTEDNDESNNTELLYAKVLLREGGERTMSSFITKSLEEYNAFKQQPFDYYATFDVKMCTTILQRILCTIEFDTENPHGTKIVRSIVDLLTYLISMYPNLDIAYTMLAKVNAETGRMGTAKDNLTACLLQCRNCTNAMICMANLEISSRNFSAGRHSLDEALSLDFSIQGRPDYCFAKGLLLLNANEYVGAKKELKKVVDVFTIKEKKELHFLSRIDAMEAFKSMATVLSVMGEEEEIAKALLLAEEVFRELSRFSLNAKAQIYLSSGHVEEYKQCCKQVLDLDKSSKSYATYGDALQKINCSEDSFKAYSTALQLDPSEEMALQIGNHLIESQAYDRAIKHFNQYLNEFRSSSDLHKALSTLYMDLERYPEALSTLDRLRDIVSGQPAEIQTWKDMAHIQQHLGKTQCAIDSLLHAKTLLHALYHIKGSTTKVIDSTLAEEVLLLMDLSKTYESNKQLSLAIEQSKEAVKIACGSCREDALYLLGTQSYKNSQLDLCVKSCQELLQINPQNREYVILLSNTLHRQSKMEESLSLLQKHFEDHPNCYDIVSRLITFYNNMNKGMESTKLYHTLQHSSSADSKIILEEPGGNWFCQGLCLKANGDTPNALTLFHRAIQCRDSKWSRKAYINSIELRLCLDDFDLWCQPRNDSNESAQLGQIDHKAIFALLKDLKEIDPDSKEAKTLRGYYEILKAIETKDYSKAIRQFNIIIKIDEDHVPALLGLAITHNFESSSQSKFRNTLKKVAKLCYTPEYGTEFERSWILLALSYMDRKKFDLSIDLCNRCIFYNPSCTKAWEIMGTALDSQGKHVDAIECYERCDAKQSPQSSIAVAMYRMQKGRFMDALTTACEVLKYHPELTHMRDVIFNECLPALRP